jgi:flagellar hook-associated protein 3 FlgL
MRVTELMIFQSTLNHTEGSRENLAKAQAEVSSGIRVQHPGDDPVAAALSVGHTVDKARFASVGQVAQRAVDELNVVDDVLGTVGTLASKAVALATQFGNDSYNAEDRASAALEIDGIFSQVIGLLNSRYDGKYVFAGFNDRTTPFDGSGVYHGDDGVRQVEIAPGLYQDASLNANVIVKGAGGGVDFLQTLTDLSTMLRSNNGDGIRGQLDHLNTSVTQIAVGRTQAGMAQNSFQSAVTTSRVAVSDEKVRIGRLLDADIIDASMRLSSAQYALNATLTAAARTMNLSLVDKLPNG